jgi:hypothetical protein
LEGGKGIPLLLLPSSFLRSFWSGHPLGSWDGAGVGNGVGCAKLIGR